MRLIVIALMVFVGACVDDTDLSDPMPSPPTGEEIETCHYCRAWTGCFETAALAGVDTGVMFCGTWELAFRCLGDYGTVEQAQDGSLHCVLDGHDVGDCVGPDIMNEYNQRVESECLCFRGGSYDAEWRGFYDPDNGCYYSRCRWERVDGVTVCVDF